DGDEAIVMTMTWSAELFLDGARVAGEDDSIVVQSIDCGDPIVARAPDVRRKQQTAAIVHVHQEAVRATARGALRRTRCHGKVTRCRRATYPHAALPLCQQRL